MVAVDDVEARMGTRAYPFPHEADVVVVCDQLQADLVEQAREQKMAFTRVSDREFRLARTGVELTFAVSDDALLVTGSLGFLVEPLRGRLEKGLHEGMPRLLRRCEALGRAGG